MKILLGMSGGLDSTCAAKRLLEFGHSVTGALLLMHEYTDLLAAERSAREIGLPLITEDCRALFDRTVKETLAREYAQGRTPNPCVICNAEVKLRRLYELAMQEGYDAIATGHYAAVVRCGDRYAVKMADYRPKDQSYMLWALPQEILSRLILPLAAEEKPRLRREAEALSLSSASAEESQEICFLPDGDYPSFVEGRCGPFPEGDFVDASGQVLGRHRGIHRYTVGQRKGLGIALGKRMFVTRILPQENRVVLSEDASLGDPAFRIEHPVFSGLPPRFEGEERFSVKLRYAAKPQPASVRFDREGATVLLDASKGPLPYGQSAVFYREDTVMLGGVILPSPSSEKN